MNLAYKTSPIRGRNAHVLDVTPAFLYVGEIAGLIVPHLHIQVFNLPWLLYVTSSPHALQVITGHPNPTWSPSPSSNTTSSMKPSQMLPVRLPCFLPHLFSANSPSITALTCLNVPLPRPESDVPSSLHLAEGLVQDRNTVAMAILLNC